MTVDEPERPGLPVACATAFKEWAGVCAALLSGRQVLILRKGGIEEGPGGFRPEHDVFWLYPTRVHQAQQGLKPEAREGPAGGDETPDDAVTIRGLARVDRVHFVDDRARLAGLDPWHVWTAETVEKRFAYRRPGLWVLVVRVYRRDAGVTLPVTPEQAGCRSWVPLSAPVPTAGLTPVLGVEAFRAAAARVEDAVGPR